MDIIENIEIPSFEKKRDKFRRGVTLLTGTIAIAVLLERYNGCVTRGLKSMKRGAAAALMAWMEDRSGTRLFTLEGDEPPPLSSSALQLSAQRVAAGTGWRNASFARPSLPQRQRSSGSGQSQQRPAANEALSAAHQLPVVVTTTIPDLQHVYDATQMLSHSQPTSHVALNADGTPGSVDTAATPQFFQSTKFFAVLDVEEAKELFSATNKVTLKPREVLFTAGEPSEAGIFIVVSGQLGVFLTVAAGGPPVHANTLRYGESVGDLDVVDNAPRSVTCIALDEGCTMVQLPRPLFMAFVHSHPHALLQYLQQGLARLWRVAHFMLSDYLALTLHKPTHAPTRPGEVKCDAATQTTPEFASYETSADPSVHGPQPFVVPDPRAVPHDKASPSSSASAPTVLVLPSLGPMRVPAARISMHETILEGEEPLTIRSSIQEGMELSGEMDSAALSELRIGTGVSDPSASMTESLRASRARHLPSAAGVTADDERSATEWSSGGGAGSAVTAGSAIAATAPALTSAFAAAAMEKPEELDSARQSFTQPNGEGRAVANGATGADKAPAKAEKGPKDPGDRHGVMQAPGDMVDDDEAVRAGLKAAAQKLSAIQFQQEQQQQAEERRARQRQRKQAAAQPQGPMMVGPVCKIQRSPSLRYKFEFGRRACLADGWDVVDVEELKLSEKTWARLTDSSQQLGHPLLYSRGQSLQEVDWACAQFYLLLDGHLMAERRVPAPATNPATAHQGNMDGYITEAAIIRPGSAISCAAFLSYTSARCRIMALEPVRLVGFGWQQLEAIAFASKPRPVSPSYPRRGVMRPFSTTASGHTLGEMSRSPLDRVRDQHGRPYTGSRGRDTREPSDKGSDEEEANVDVEEVLIPLLVAAAAAMGPLIRRFISLGLNRVWLKSGDVAYRQGDDASCLFVVMSGRLRLIHESMNQVTGRPEVRVEEEVGRGEAVGAVFTIAGGQHDTTALCIRDSELVRMSKAAFKILSEESPMALARMFNNIARRIDAASNARVRGPKGSIPRSPWAGSTVGGSTRLDLVGAGAKEKSAHSARADVVTITIVPAGVMAALTAPPKGPTAHSAAMQAQAPGVAIARAVKRLSTVLQQELAAQVAKANGTDITNTKTGTPGVTGITGRTAQDGVVCFNSTSMGLKFNGAFERLDVLFYRSKITSWLSSQEDDNRFIILEADYHPTPWSSVCVAQADVILLVAAEGALPDLGECEAGLVWGAGGPPAATSRVANSTTGLAAAARAAVAAKSTPTLSSSGVPVVANPLPHIPSAAAAGIATAPCVPTMKQLLHGHDGESEPSSSGPASFRPNSIIRAANAAANIRPNPIIAAANAAAASATAGDTTLLPPPEPIYTGDTIMQAPQPMYTGDAVLQGTQPMYAVPSGPVPQNIPTAPPMAPLPGDPLQPPLPGPPLGIGGGPALPRPPIPALVRRVELVLLHSSDSSLPHDTAAWLRNRPYLARHHHVRLERQPDVARLCRWMRGKAVGLVLSGGGSRGLAHLGVLFALEDQGVPVDVVGGTSQGAFMAGLYAQGLDREAIQLAVQQYANTMGSVRHLLGDLTLPMLSLFSGRKFDDLIKSLFEGGASNIEDLWLPFFCVTTNLSRGEAMAHTRGPLWRLVRASMTIVGLLPPVCLDGELLVDGGYMNNMPVDVMRGMGVDTVIVVDVESREDLGWQSLVPYDGGLSGWRLLWDRWCPIPSWRTTSTKNLPRYAQIINQLTWMTHNHNLKRVHEEYRIDLYLRPPNIGSFKLMDFHLMERIVKDAFRDALNCLQNWSLLPEISNHVRGTGGSQPPTPGASHHNRGGNPFLLARAQSDMAAVGNGLGGYPPGSLPAGSYFAEPVTGAHFPAPPSVAVGPAYLPQQPSAKSELPASQLLRMGTGNGTVAYSYDGAYGLETRHSQEGVPTVPTHSFSRAPEFPGRSTFSMGPGTGAHAALPYSGNPSFTGPGPTRSMQAPSPIHPTSSITCMTQLQKKQTQMEAQAAALAAVTPGSAARAHSLAMAAAAGMLNSGAGVPGAGLGGAAAVDAAAFVANAGTPHTPGSLRVSSMTPGMRGPPSTGGAPGGSGGAHLLPLSASAAAAPPPSAAAIAVEALSRVSYTGGSVAGVPGARHSRASDRASEHSNRASEQSNSKDTA